MTRRFVAKILLRINVKNERAARGRASGGSSHCRPLTVAATTCKTCD